MHVQASFIARAIPSNERVLSLHGGDFLTRLIPMRSQPDGIGTSRSALVVHYSSHGNHGEVPRSATGHPARYYAQAYMVAEFFIAAFSASRGLGYVVLIISLLL